MLMLLFAFPRRTRQMEFKCFRLKSERFPNSWLGSHGCELGVNRDRRKSSLQRSSELRPHQETQIPLKSVVI